MIAEDREGWADLELQLGIIANKFNNIDTYIKCIDDIRKKLYEYLKSIKEKPDYSKIKDFFIHIDINDTIFIVLNYTKCFEEFIQKQYPNEKPIIYYPHGTIENNDIILGVGAPTHIKKFTYNKLIESKLIKQNIVDYNSFFPMYDFYDNINIFGTSFGSCDGRMWCQVLIHLLLLRHTAYLKY